MTDMSNSDREPYTIYVDKTNFIGSIKTSQKRKMLRCQSIR